MSIKNRGGLATERSWAEGSGSTSANAASPSYQRTPEDEKTAITAACERFIAEVLKPRFLLRIEPTCFNYPVNLHGKWHGNKYRFIQRFRSDHPDAITPEFDAPFERLEYVGRDCFDLSYYRHTGEWFCLYQFVPFAEALRLIESDGHLHPV
jgi:hypothetical protein